MSDYVIIKTLLFAHRNIFQKLRAIRNISKNITRSRAHYSTHKETIIII